MVRFFDKTDGVTPETALTVTNCHLTLMVDDSNVPTLVLDANATASGGNNDMVHVTGDDAGFYDLELTAANLNYLGRAMLAITDAANHCPVFHEFMILPAMVYDSLVLGTDRFDTNVTHVNDVAASSVTTINANLGQTQPVNFTGTGASALVKGDMVDIAGAAVSTSLAQIGVNIINAAGTAWNSGSISASTLATDTITAVKIAADAIGASELATDAVQEIRNAITGGAWALDTDANGRIRIVDGTGTGEIDTTSGAIAHVILADTITTYTGDTPQTGDSFARIGVAGAGLTAADDATLAAIAALNNITAASVWAVATRTLTALGFTLGASDLAAGTITAAKFAAGAIDAAAIAADAIGASELASDAVTEIRNAITGGAWALNTDANGSIRIVDGTSTGEIDTTSGGVAVTAASVRTALGLASANLDTQLDTLPTANENADAFLDRSSGVEASVTPRQYMRATGAILAGIISGAGTGTEVFKGLSLTSGGTTRVTVTVDSSGNRSALSLNL